MEKLRAAATQIRIEPANVKLNLEKAIELIVRAHEKRADIVVLPEFFTSGIALNEKMMDVPRMNGALKVLQTIRGKAMRYRLYVAGSFLRVVGEDVRNSMFLIGPSGSTGIHDKDIPTQFENCYYTSGDGNRSFGRYGLALCWEMLRRKTIRELSDTVEVVLGGSCWWSLPIGNSNPDLDRYNEELNRRTPSIFATAAGLPVVHSSLVGEIETERSVGNRERVVRRLIGTTQIVSGTGEVIRAIEEKDRDDLIVEDIIPGSRKNNDGAEVRRKDAFWLCDLRQEYLSAWERENSLGKEQYLRNRERLTAGTG